MTFVKIRPYYIHVSNKQAFFWENNIPLVHELFSHYLSCRRLLLGTQKSWGSVRTVFFVIMTAELWSRTRVCEEEKVPVLSSLFSVNITTNIKLVRSYNTPQNVWNSCLISRTIPFTFLFLCKDMYFVFLLRLGHVNTKNPRDHIDTETDETAERMDRFITSVISYYQT